MPALACVVLLTVLGLGPGVTTEPVKRYWTSARTWGYLQNLAFVGVYDLPGVFLHSDRAIAVNGCLWTLGLGVLGNAVLAASHTPPRRRDDATTRRRDDARQSPCSPS